MKCSLAVLLLGLESAWAQSREASQWDELVPGYGGSVTDCPCVGDACGIENSVTIVQDSSTSVTATFTSGAALKFAYLTDQDGTIIDYKSASDVQGFADDPSITFSWDAWASNDESEFPWPGHPTGVVPHIVYNPTCADVYPTVIEKTWAGVLDGLAQMYDVGNNAQNFSATNEMTPSVDIGNLPNSWFTTGGTFSAEFPAATSTTLSNDEVTAVWVENQDGVLLHYEQSSNTAKINVGSSAFPRGSTDITACRLTPLEKHCTTKNLASDYVEKIETLTTTDAGTNPSESFAAVFSVSRNYRDKTRVGPVSSSCTKYAIYAKTDSDNETLLGFGFDQALEFTSTAETLENALLRFKVVLTCDGSDATGGTVDLSLVQSTTSVFGADVQAPSPECNASDGTMHASDNTTWFNVDGRDCLCDKGTLFCHAKGTDNTFYINKAAAVGLAVSVSVIVLLLICAIIFLVMKKTARSSEKQAVLQQGDVGPQSAMSPEDDRL